MAVTPARPQMCFLLGILQRCGTNHLSRLLSLHPQVIGPGPIWEDYLLQESELLGEYANRLYERWNPDWDIPGKVGPREVMLSGIGRALEGFLHRQSRRAVAPRIRLTKTPSVKGLENFTALFPAAKLIVLVRDGRAVVESGVRSFDWDYDDAIRDWTQAARTILEFRDACPDVDRRMLLVRYEDLVREEAAVLRRIFAFLGLDAAVFDFEAASRLDVLGSSDSRKPGTEITWDQPTPKTADFRPLERARDWGEGRREAFWKIAGPYAKALGYGA